MSSQIWRVLYPIIVQEARAMDRPRRKTCFSDQLIVGMFFWMVLHDRTQEWACHRSSYHAVFRPRVLPSPSQFSRRLRSPRCLELLKRVERAAAPCSTSPCCYLDARPLAVGTCSKDPDAKPGRVYGGFARGYRVHSLLDEKETVIAWKLEPMNVAEVTVAPELLRQAPAGSSVLADSNYDRAPLYEIAAEHGATLLAKPRVNAGKGHRPQSAARLASIAQWQADPQTYASRRTHVERAQAHQSSFAGGLQPLPAWVRRLHRVKRWVAAKLVINHVRLQQKEHAA